MKLVGENAVVWGHQSKNGLLWKIKNLKDSFHLFLQSVLIQIWSPVLKKEVKKTLNEKVCLDFSLACAMTCNNIWNILSWDFLIASFLISKQLPPF